MTQLKNTYKSPFFVVEEFISPLMCEDVLDLVDFTVPNKDKDDKETSTVKESKAAEAAIYERLVQLIPSLMEHYGIEYKGTEPIKFEWYPPGASKPLHAENSEFIKEKWLRVRACDLTAVLFLSDYQNSPAFDQEYEVYGGKLEFPQHQFGFNPNRGTLVVFPSAPHFINQSTTVLAGDLYQARINIVAKAPYLYDPTKFPGNYTVWFK